MEAKQVYEAHKPYFDYLRESSRDARITITEDLKILAESFWTWAKNQPDYGHDVIQLAKEQGK